MDHDDLHRFLKKIDELFLSELLNLFVSQLSAIIQDLSEARHQQQHKICFLAN